MRTHIPFLDYPTETPMISLRLQDGTPIIAVVDTGSETTLLDADLLKDQMPFLNKKEDEGLNLIGIQYDSSSSPVSVSTAIWIGDEVLFPIKDAGIMDLTHVKEYFKKAFKGEFKYIILLGSDTLTQMKAFLDFEHKVLSCYYDISSE